MAVTRELSITYGALTFGPPPRAVDGTVTSFEDTESGTFGVTWRTLVTGSSEAVFATTCLAVEDAMGDRFEDLTVAYGSETHITLAHSTNSALNTKGSWEKLDEPGTTGRSRWYLCTVTATRPANDNTDRLDTSVVVSEDESKIRTLTISGTITAAVGGSDAYANAVSKVPTFAGTVTSTLGGTWDKGLLTIDRDDQDKIASYTWEQREIVYNESTAGLDSANIIRADVRFTSSDTWPGDTPGKATRRTQIVATYTAGVDATASTDLVGLYTGTIRPYLISEARRLYSPSTLAIIEESPGTEASGNRIASRIVFDAVIDDAQAYEYTAAQLTRTDTGSMLIKKWDGTKWGGKVLDVKADATRTTVVTSTNPNAVELAPVAHLGEVAGNGDNGAPQLPERKTSGWVCIGIEHEATPTEIGNQYGDPLQVTLNSWTITEVYMEESEDEGPPTTPEDARTPTGDAPGGDPAAPPTTPTTQGTPQTQSPPSESGILPPLAAPPSLDDVPGYPSGPSNPLRPTRIGGQGMGAV